MLVWPPPFGPAQPADSRNWFVRGASVRSQADTQSTAHSLRTERSRDGAHVGVGARSDGRPPSGPRGLLSVSNLSHSPCGSSGHRCLFGPAGARVTGPCLRGDLAWPVKARRSGIREDLSTPPPPQEPSRKSGLHQGRGSRSEPFGLSGVRRLISNNGSHSSVVGALRLSRPANRAGRQTGPYEEHQSACQARFTGTSRGWPLPCTGGRGSCFGPFGARPLLPTITCPLDLCHGPH